MALHPPPLQAWRLTSDEHCPVSRDTTPRLRRLAALQDEAQAQVETRRSEMKSRIKQQTAASVARHAARKQAQHALERFCTATEEELAAASPVDTAVAVDSGACVGTALPVGDGMVAPSASDSDLPAVSVVRDAALAVRLASLVVPVLRNTTAAFNGKVVPIATHIATGRCCDEVIYASHPVHGAMYRMKLPVVSASDVVGGGRASGGADDDAAPVAYVTSSRGVRVRGPGCARH